MRTDLGKDKDVSDRTEGVRKDSDALEGIACSALLLLQDECERDCQVVGSMEREATNRLVLCVDLDVDIKGLVAQGESPDGSQDIVQFGGLVSVRALEELDLWDAGMHIERGGTGEMR